MTNNKKLTSLFSEKDSSVLKEKLQEILSKEVSRKLLEKKKELAKKIFNNVATETK